MSRTTRTAAGALAVTVALGIGSPVLTAASAAESTVAPKAGHVKVAKSDKGKKGAQEQRQVLRDIARTDARLVKAARESRTARIGEHAAGVLANVAADRAMLDELAAAVQAPESGLALREVRRAVKELRPQNYARVINDLRRAIRLAGEIAEARTAVEGDLAAPVGELDAAQVSLDEAVAGALAITASSDRDEFRAVKSHLNAVSEALEVVRHYLGGSEEEPVEDEPVEDEPVEDEPVED